jgi:hypothetical protein
MGDLVYILIGFLQDGGIAEAGIMLDPIFPVINFRVQIIYFLVVVMVEETVETEYQILVEAEEVTARPALSIN